MLVCWNQTWHRAVDMSVNQVHCKLMSWIIILVIFKVSKIFFFSLWPEKSNWGHEDVSNFSSRWPLQKCLRHFGTALANVHENVLHNPPFRVTKLYKNWPNVLLVMTRNGILSQSQVSRPGGQYNEKMVLGTSWERHFAEPEATSIYVYHFFSGCSIFPPPISWSVIFCHTIFLLCDKIQ